MATMMIDQCLTHYDDDEVHGEWPDLHGVQSKQIGDRITVAWCTCPDCERQRAAEEAGE